MSDDVLIALEGMLPQIDAALQGRRLGASVERAAERLSGARRHAERLEGFVKAAALLGLRDDRDAVEILTGVVRKARHLAGAMVRAETAAQLDDLGDLFRDFTAAITSLELSVRQRWRRLIEAEFLPFVALSEVLSRIPDLETLAGSLLKFGGEARETIDRRTPPEALVAEINKLRANRDQLDADLQSLTGDPEIDGFLKAVTAHKATLAMVTPGVLRWLADHDALTTFTVGAGRS